MADEPFNLTDLVATTAAIGEWMTAEGASYAFIGGLAVALRGRVRATNDVDAIVLMDVDDIEELIDNGRPLGFTPRNEGEAQFARANKVIRMTYGPRLVDVDLSIALTSFETEAIRTATRIDAYGVSIPVISVERLCAMKAFARRTRDLADIEGLLDGHPDLDLRSVRRWRKELGTAVDDDTILRDFEALVRRWRKRQAQLFPNP
jgi:hypothetical protein